MTPRDDLLRERLRAGEAWLTRQAEKSLRAFVEQAWPILEPHTPFLANWHIDLMAEYLEAVSAGQITRLVINVPPRYMKSLLVSVFWPVWEWVHAPHTRWLFASYSESLATKHSLDRRMVLQSAGDTILSALVADVKAGSVHVEGIGLAWLVLGVSACSS